MSITYLVFKTFDARMEAEALLHRFSKPPAQMSRLYSIIDVFHSLKEAEIHGFNGITEKLERTGYEDLFLYEDGDVVAAINVPGNGRAQTRDLTLIGTLCVEAEGREQRAKIVSDFLRAMNERRRCGAIYHDWN